MDRSVRIAPCSAVMAITSASSGACTIAEISSDSGVLGERAFMNRLSAAIFGVSFPADSIVVAIICAPNLEALDGEADAAAAAKAVFETSAVDAMAGRDEDATILVPWIVTGSAAMRRQTLVFEPNET